MIDPFVSWEWCEKNRDDIVIVDVQWNLTDSGHEAYAAGHIPRAPFIDMNTELSGPGEPELGRHPLPSSERFAAAMSKAGIDGSRPVVAYDANGGVYAARLVWLLRALGIEAALLDGGLAAYPGRLEAGWPEIIPANFDERPWPAEVFASVDDILEAKQTGAIVIDARPGDRFVGADAVDARSGHMPGAKSVPCRDHLTADGTMRSPQELRETFTEAGIDEDSNVISSCGSGITACHNLLAMEYAGLPKGRLFPPSWSGWSANPDLPIERG